MERSDYQIVIRTQGVVRAHNESSLTPEVAGRVSWISPDLQDGAFFSEGDVLVELDDADFQTAVVATEADLARAQAALAQEEARAKQAKINWEELYGNVAGAEPPNELVLRLPQLREAKANVKAAEASNARAQRDLDRTRLRAPFDGRVLTKTVSLGQSVSPSASLATVYATDFVEVRLPISSVDLPFLTLPEGAGSKPVDVELTDTLNAESTASWAAKIVGVEGALDENSRELFAIARILDPFELEKPPAERGAPLRVGQPVSAAIDGKILKDVVAVPRSSVRQLRRIFLVTEKDDGLVLEPHEIDPVWQDAEYYVVRDPTLAEGTLLATTRLVYAPKESPVEILPDTPPEVEVAGDRSAEEDS